MVQSSDHTYINQLSHTWTIYQPDNFFLKKDKLNLAHGYRRARPLSNNLNSETQWQKDALEWNCSLYGTESAFCDLKPIVTHLVTHGLLIPFKSPFNASILAAKKSDNHSYHLVQDLTYTVRLYSPSIPSPQSLHSPVVHTPL